jgi:hypothetical protein
MRTLQSGSAGAGHNPCASDAQAGKEARRVSDEVKEGASPPAAVGDEEAEINRVF